MKNLLGTDCIALTATESEQVYGGTNKPTFGFWQNLAFIAGTIVQSIDGFSTQAGRNADLFVK